MSALIFDRFVVDWTPKGGCTVVLKMWYEHAGLLDTVLDHSSWIHDWRCQKGTHMHYKPGKTNVNNAVFIKFVRNPYSRAVSSYIHASRSHILHALADGGNNMTFKHFILEHLPSRMQENPHWKPQHMCHGVAEFDHIIKIEELEDK